MALDAAAHRHPPPRKHDTALPTGKTTLALAIKEALGKNIAYLSHDNYYKDISHLSFEERASHNFDHPDSLDTDLMYEHVMQLKQGKSVDIPTYDFATHSRTKETVHVEAQVGAGWAVTKCISPPKRPPV